MQSLDIRVASNGHMVLPLALRRATGLHGDTKIIATFADGGVRLSPIHRRFSGGTRRGNASRQGRPLMPSAVLDASAVLALLRDESGADKCCRTR
jgi:hypothetical protein